MVGALHLVRRRKKRCDERAEDLNRDEHQVSFDADVPSFTACGVDTESQRRPSHS